MTTLENCKEQLELMKKLKMQLSDGPTDAVTEVDRLLALCEESVKRCEKNPDLFDVEFKD